jgi:hypothetical protein
MERSRVGERLRRERDVEECVGDATKEGVDRVARELSEFRAVQCSDFAVDNRFEIRKGNF